MTVDLLFSGRYPMSKVPIEIRFHHSDPIDTRKELSNGMRYSVDYSAGPKVVPDNVSVTTDKQAVQAPSAAGELHVCLLFTSTSYPHLASPTVNKTISLSVSSSTVYY